jgi:hypothetical protein
MVRCNSCSFVTFDYCRDQRMRTGSHAARGATEGAAMGAASCAVGSIVGSLVFGGNVLDNAARSGVYCGAAGAFAGGVQGSALDKKEQQARDNELARLRQFAR